MEQNQDSVQKQHDFMVLYKPLHNRLCKFVHSMIWDKEDAKDIVNETALQAFERFDQIKDKEKFMSYVFSIAGNLAKRRYKLQKVKALFDWVKADNQEAWQHSEQTLTQSELRKALDQVPFKQRRALLLFEVFGFSYNEICTIENCSLSAVKTRIFQAKTKLRHYLANDEVPFGQLKSVIV
ncbi:MAG: RNA polymerase sigma factor [Bacteroidia bacterium]|jgi:RNA polymerase sigma-70 factor (ECF subfamily)|nr:RNA polymerase sigma factor [Bacteroidia bacterium]